MNEEELKKTIGGGISTAKWSAIGILVGGLVTLLVGIFDGFKRPLPCNK